MAYGSLSVGLGLLVVLSRIAHHGSTGRYDRTRPLYVTGTVTEAAWEYPHAQLTLDVPQGIQVPADAQRFGQLDELNERDIVGRLAPVPAGRTEILMPPEIMNRLIPDDDRPERGAEVEAVVFRRCDQGNTWDGELRVQAFTAPSGEVLFRSAGTLSRYSDGCPGEADDDTPTSSSTGQNGTPTSGTGEPPTSGTGGQGGGEDGDVPVGAIAAVTGAGVAGITALAWVIRRRRHVGGR